MKEKILLRVLTEPDDHVTSCFYTMKGLTS